jgi:hypothetical protein
MACVVKYTFWARSRISKSHETLSSPLSSARLQGKFTPDSERLAVVCGNALCSFCTSGLYFYCRFAWDFNQPCLQFAYDPLGSHKFTDCLHDRLLSESILGSQLLISYISIQHVIQHLHYPCYELIQPNTLKVAWLSALERVTEISEATCYGYVQLCAAVLVGLSAFTYTSSA